MRIDVHNHIFPPVYVDAVGVGTLAAIASSGRAPTWSVDLALETMDRNQVAMAVTSVSAPGFVVDPAILVRTVRGSNEFAAQMVRDHPTRFGMFAALPIPDIDATLAEIEYAFDTLGADGVCLLSNYDGLYLGDPALKPMFAELDRRGAVVFVHPTSVKGAPVLPGVSQSTLEFTFDTTRTAASLLFGGVMTNCRRVRFVFSHAGGAIPYLAHRMEVLSHNAPQLREGLPDGVVAELARCYYDTALSAGPTTFGSLLKLVPPEQVLFGSDFPFGPKNQMAGAVAGLDAMALSEGTRRGIDGQNAIALMPSLARVRAHRL
jgi:predicted TIM-barrel fold metal-dependent hydrolase